MAYHRGSNGRLGGGGGGGEAFRRVVAPPGWRLGVGYGRASTEGQVEIGDSERRQIAREQRYAERKKILVVDRYDDFGVPAYRGRHRKSGNMLRMVEDAENLLLPPLTPVIAENVDRVTREAPYDAHKWVFRMFDAGLELHIVNLDRHFSRENYNEPGVAKLLHDEIDRSHRESKDKGERVAEAAAERRENATGGEDGETFTAHCPGWLAKKPGGGFKWLHDRVATVRRIHRLYLEGNGVKDIVAILNTTGPDGKPGRTPTFGRRGQGIADDRRSRLWASSSVHRILTSRAVLGHWQPHREEWRWRAHNDDGTEGEAFLDAEGKPEERKVRVKVGPEKPGYYGDPVIDEADFQEVRDKLKERRYKSGGGTLAKNPLRNLLRHIARCGLCGAPMHSRWEQKWSKTYHWLRCSAAWEGSGCGLPMVDYPPIERGVISVVVGDDLFNPAALAPTSAKRSEAETRLKAARARLRALEQQNESAFKKQRERPPEEAAEFERLISLNVPLIGEARAAVADLEANARREKDAHPVEHALAVQGVLAEAHRGDPRARVKVAESLQSCIMDVLVFPDRQFVRMRHSRSVFMVVDGRLEAAEVEVDGKIGYIQRNVTFIGERRPGDPPPDPWSPVGLFWNDHPAAKRRLARLLALARGEEPPEEDEAPEAAAE